MELPPALRAAVDRALDGVSVADLSAAARTLSARYRGEVRDGRAHLSDAMAALAYLAVRLPATYAAVRSAMAATSEASPDFAPGTLLDVGAGPGTALWAAADAWPSLQRAHLVEGSAAIRDQGKTLTEAASVPAAWAASDLEGEFEAEPSDLVTAAYVLNELSDAGRARLAERLWGLTRGVLLIVEPGTSGGWARLMEVRAQLIGLGAHILAPCPHALACPLAPPDFCRFSRRVARTRLHRLVKVGEAGWEDETFIYLAAARFPPRALGSRVLAEPRAAKGRIDLKLCEPQGTARARVVTKRDPAAWRIARRLDWGGAGTI